MYKLIMRMEEKLSQQRNEELDQLKDYMCGMIFEKLSEVEDLKVVSAKHAPDFRESTDYTKINQIIQQYLSKYRKDLSNYSQARQPLPAIKEQLTRSILTLYSAV